MLKYPGKLCWNRSGELLAISDTGNHCIKVVDERGFIQVSGCILKVSLYMHAYYLWHCNYISHGGCRWSFWLCILLFLFYLSILLGVEKLELRTGVFPTPCFQVLKDCVGAMRKYLWLTQTTTTSERFIFYLGGHFHF